MKSIGRILSLLTLAACLTAACGAPNYFLETEARSRTEFDHATPVYVALNDYADSLDVEWFHRLRRVMREEGMNLVEDPFNAEAVLIYAVTENGVRVASSSMSVPALRSGHAGYSPGGTSDIFTSVTAVGQLEMALYTIEDFAWNVDLSNSAAADPPATGILRYRPAVWFGASSADLPVFKKNPDDLITDLLKRIGHSDKFSKQFWKSRDKGRQ